MLLYMFFLYKALKNVISKLTSLRGLLCGAIRETLRVFLGLFGQRFGNEGGEELWILMLFRLKLLIQSIALTMLFLHRPLLQNGGRMYLKLVPHRRRMGIGWRRICGGTW
ncbi:hypothetical protein Lal_00038902 [Lupinus albus]|nr:hypothetical protein Lal_00038902 [Lupinus albus]